ncbi:MAG: hypothetical protein HY369_00400 [Candidatus Aenigmarchaeota archaeon]|nr:hypothetical protein [Candidatus Aenigmarchaeota archaeon]
MYCIVCKDHVTSRYEVQVRDTAMDTSLQAAVCRFCYHKFVDSFHDRGFFKVGKMLNWIKKRDPQRVV